MKYDCIVIGSGVSGLAAASTMAQQGLRIALLEKHTTLSPLLRRFRKNGRWCDTGFHYSGCLGQEQLFTAFFRYLGIESYLKPLPLDSECYDVIRVGEDQEYRLPGGWSHLQEYLSHCFPASVTAVEAYLTQTRKLVSETSYLNLDLPWGSFAEIERDPRSLRQFLQDHDAEAPLIDLLGNHGSLLHGSSDQEVPFAVHAYVMGSLYANASMLERGGDAIVDGFHSHLLDAGVDLFTGDGVQSIECDDKRNVRGVTTEQGEQMTCDNCICTTHPALLAQMLPETRATVRFRERMSNMVDTAGPLILYCEIDNEIPDFRHRNHYVFRSNRSDVKMKSPMAVIATGADYDLNGGKNNTVLRYLTESERLQGITQYQSTDYYAAKEQLIRETLDDLEEYFPSLSGRIKVAAAATPATLHRFTGTVNGAIYGTRQSVNQPRLMPLTPIRGLYLAGQSVIPGVVGAMLSGLMAVFEIIEGRLIWEQIRACR